MPDLIPHCVVRQGGVEDYQQTLAAMTALTDARRGSNGERFGDEIWLLEHPPLFTRGTSSRQQPRTNPHHFPVIQSNRGGQITYHGPGQLIAYLLFDIRRLNIGPRSLVNRVEQGMINLLTGYGLDAERQTGAPGVYVDQAKIAALGLRIRNGCCFHGLSINVNVDLEPFNWIDPCGMPGLAVTRLADLVPGISLQQTADDLIHALQQQFNWTGISRAAWNADQ